MGPEVNRLKHSFCHTHINILISTLWQRLWAAIYEVDAKSSRMCVHFSCNSVWKRVNMMAIYRTLSVCFEYGTTLESEVTH